MSRADDRGFYPISTVTREDRYAELFAAAAAELLGAGRPGLRLLSYGCADGSECLSLRRYFPAATIVGTDVNPIALDRARRRNRDPDIYFVESNQESLGRLGRFDLILALSVLCRWPATRGVESCAALYPFRAFEGQIETLDDLLRRGGLLAIYNSSYRFTDTSLAQRYRAEEVTAPSESGFVTRFDPSGARSTGIPDARVFFRKLRSVPEAEFAPGVDDRALARELEPGLTACALRGYLDRMPRPASPVEWRAWCEALLRWIELAGAEELRSGVPGLVRRLLGGEPLPAPEAAIARLFDGAFSAPAVLAQPDWLLASELLSAELRARVPPARLQRLLTRLIGRLLRPAAAPVSSRAFFELIGWLTALPGGDEGAPARMCRRYVRGRLAGMDPVERIEWLLGLPGELDFAPEWPAFRLRLLARVLDRQTAPVVLRRPGRIVPGGADDLPPTAVETLLAALVAGGHYAAAVPWAEYAALSSGSARHLRAWGRALLGAGEVERAYQVFGEAIERHPENGPLRRDWAAAAARLGHYSEIVLRVPGGDRARRALARNVAAAALRPDDGRAGPAAPTLGQLRRKLGIDELVRGVDVASFRRTLGLPPLGGAATAAAGRWLMLGYETYNIGDEIQGVAAARLLPRIDGLLDRDDLGATGAGGGRAILNGWYMLPGLDGRYRWPPPPSLQGLWVSMHISPMHAPGLLTAEGIDYLRSVGGPIGCRDLYTRELLRAVGVEADFTGCLTLTLPRIERRRGPAVCFTDLDHELEAALGPTVKRRFGVRPCRLAHRVGRGSLREAYEARVEAAVELLAVYASAALVVTSRLHAALPCIALGTPVLMVLHDPTDLRYGGLLDTVSALSRAQCLAEPERALEQARHPRVIPGWAEELKARARNFVG